MRVEGHTLWYEGAVHDASGLVVLPIRRGGRGRGRCSCNALSEMLDSGAARRRWHRRHKQEVLDG